MKIRHRMATTALCCGLLTGTLAFAPVTAHAAPRVAVASPANDPLAARAREIVANTSAPTYAGQRDQLAAEIATRLQLDPAAMQQAWARADMPHQIALLSALGQMGVPYRRNTSQVGVGFDCSGLTTYAWGQAGVTLTRQSAAQIKASAKRTIATAQAGDLVYYPGHISMWLGVGYAIVHSPYTGRNVEVSFVGKKKIKRATFGDPSAQA